MNLWIHFQFDSHFLLQLQILLHILFFFIHELPINFIKSNGYKAENDEDNR